MNKFKVIAPFIFALTILTSCHDNDDEATYTLRDFGQQYLSDSTLISTYLQTHYIKSITDQANTVEDQNIEIDAITDPDTQSSIWLDTVRLKHFEVSKNGVDYTVFYIKQRVGDDPTGIQPTRVDDVLASYDGYYLSGSSASATETRFQYAPFPVGYLNLTQTIAGWAEILPKFKSGSPVTPTPGQPQAYSGFGAGVMFIPSGLAYFNAATVTIPSYSPLMFKFKLYGAKRSDLDNDGITSYDENAVDGVFSDVDTDGDGVQDYLDYDDDGDGYITKNEVGYDGGETKISWDAIPDCSGNITDVNRRRKHLDSSCH